MFESTIMSEVCDTNYANELVRELETHAHIDTIVNRNTQLTVASMFACVY